MSGDDDLQQGETWLDSPTGILIADLAEWIPSLVKDGRPDPKAAYDLLESLGEAEEDGKFVLSWSGKAEALQNLRNPPQGALVPDTDASLNWNSAEHVYCIGENLEVLKLLQRAYFARVRMIYVDPPYESFEYSDNLDDPLRAYLRFIGETSDGGGRQPVHGVERRHSRWLTMMFPRLVALRNLLTPDGVIFVCIDDHEVHHLRMLMDEVFGEENFVCTFIWEKRYSPAPDAVDVGYVHENILCYRRSDAFSASLLPMTEAQRARYRNRDNHPRGPWKPADYTCRYSANERPTLYYPIINPNTGKEKWPKKSRVWANSKKEHEANEKENLIWWPPTAEFPARKKFISEIKQGAMPKSLLTHKEVGHTDQATKELQKWVPDAKVTPKPVKLIRHLMSVAGLEHGDLFLDPFARAGSGGEAVAQEAAADNKYRGIFIQMPVPTSEASSMNLAEIGLKRTVGSLKASEVDEAGLRVFRLQRCQLPRWKLRGSVTTEVLVEQLEAFAEKKSSITVTDDILYNAVLASGVQLDAAMEKKDIDGIHVAVFPNFAAAICVAGRISRNAINELVSLPIDRLLVCESAFDGDEGVRLSLIHEGHRQRIEVVTI